MKKRIKTKWKGLLTVLMLISSTASFSKTAQHGERGGNGGGVWVCQNKDSNGTIRKIEFVDFYEAEKEFKYIIDKHIGLDFQTILNIYKDRIFEIDENFALSLEPYLSSLNEKLNLVDADLEIIDDALFRVKPPQRWCQDGIISYEQLANYTNYGSILLNEYLYKHARFSELERAGFLLHEAIYAYLRYKSKDKDSQRARRFVGIIASTLSTEQAREALELTGLSAYIYKMDFVNIAKGSFVMGSSRAESYRVFEYDEDQVNVTITKDFSIMKTEVTQLQYFHIMGINPSYYKKIEDCPDTHVIINNQQLCPNNPVESISWDAIQIFIDKLNFKEGRIVYRLPTEAEWEYAARAGTTSEYSFIGAYIGKYAWYSGNSGDKPHAVATRLANNNGLFDMHGNVWEWVQDYYFHILPGGIDPFRADGSHRVLRGGAYNASEKYLRSASRSSANPKEYSEAIGFRLVKIL